MLTLDKLHGFYLSQKYFEGCIHTSGLERQGGTRVRGQITLFILHTTIIIIESNKIFSFHFILLLCYYKVTTFLLTTLYNKYYIINKYKYVRNKLILINNYLNKSV